MFKKLFLLDLNIIGLVTSFINDELNYLYYLEKNNIKPYYKNINWTNVNIDWTYISNNIDNYDHDSLIIDFRNKLNWDIITTKKVDDYIFLSKYSDYINFEIFNLNMNFPDLLEYEFFNRCDEKIDWIKISRWSNMAEDFIDMFHDKLNWNILCKTQGLTGYIMNKYYNKLILEDLRYNCHIERTIKDEIINRLTNDLVINSENNNIEMN